jgi:hypothetical protein
LRYYNENVTTTHYVRSSVLGGVVIAELDQTGAKEKASVYAGGSKIAEHHVVGGSLVEWRHPNPGTTSWITSSSDRTGTRKEMDPLGAATGTTDPYPVYLDYTDIKNGEPLYLDGGNPFDYSGGCELDGMPVSCSFVAHGIDTGSVAGQLPNGKQTGILYLPGMRYGDLSSVYVPGIGTGLTVKGEDGQVYGTIEPSLDEPGYFALTGSPDSVPTRKAMRMTGMSKANSLPCTLALQQIFQDSSAVERAEDIYDELLVPAGRDAGVSPNLLAAILIRETGVRPIAQKDGKGAGYFQIDLGQNKNVTKEQANDPIFSAKFAAQKLRGIYDQARAMGYSEGVSWGAALHFYNSGNSWKNYVSAASDQDLSSSANSFWYNCEV